MKDSLLATMTIWVNGNKREVPQGITAEELIEQFKLRKKSVVFELNHKVLDRESFAAIRLKENDTVELVHFVGGG